MKIQKSQLKALIRGIVNEAAMHEMFGSGQGMTPAQKKVVDLLQKRSFTVIKYIPNPDRSMDVVLERPYGKGKHAGPRWARVHHDGTINQDKIDVNQYLAVVGESMTTRAELDKGVMKAVNVECGLSKGGNNIGFKPLGLYNKGSVRESIHEQRPCPCGSGLMSNWETDGRGIPLCRACPKCRAEKLKRYRPEILDKSRPYTQDDVDEPIDPIDEQTSTGAVAGYSTPFAFSKKGSQGSNRAIKAAKKYGKVVKSISERVKK